MSDTTMKAPELLSPAGTLKSMRHAFAFGADAVYAGLPRYSLRVRNNDFLEENLRIGIDEAHAQNKAFYLTCNLMPHGAKVKTFLDDLDPVIAMAPDALIIADPGLIMLARQRWPALPLHLSVQANTVNAMAVRFWQSVGLKRIILSRELSLDEVEDIRQQCPDMELEVFVHGALCIAYSGRCLLSGYFNHRDANQGACTNSCRWEYRLDDSDTGQPRHPAAEKLYYLEEKERPGEFMPITEDEHGTYIMNSKDLRAVEHVERLVRIGIDSLKIEGRTKSHFYAARSTQVYRQAIDDAVAGRPFNPDLMFQLEGLANRGYTDGFFQRHATETLQNYRHASSESQREIVVGEILERRDNGEALIDVKNKFGRGDSLILLTPSGNHPFSAKALQSETGHPMDVAPGAGYRVWMQLPEHTGGIGLLVRRITDTTAEEGHEPHSR